MLMSKPLIATLALAVAAPGGIAQAQNYPGYDHGRYDAPGYPDGPRQYDRADSDGRDWRGGGDNPHRAVEQCTRAALSEAGRIGRAWLGEVRDVERTRNGFKVKGTVLVDSYRAGWHHGFGERGDYARRADRAGFSCRVEFGRVTGLDYRGLRPF